MGSCGLHVVPGAFRNDHDASGWEANAYLTLRYSAGRPSRWALAHILFLMDALWNRVGHYIFVLWFLLLLSSCSLLFPLLNSFSLAYFQPYIHFRGLLPPDGILPRAEFTLRPSLAFSYISSVTARHSIGRQPNFVAWYKEWNYGTFADGALCIRLGGHHVGHRPTF